MDESNFIPDANLDKPLPPGYNEFIDEFQDNLNADFSGIVAMIGYFDSDIECSVFVDSDKVVDEFEKWAEKFADLEIYYN